MQPDEESLRLLRNLAHELAGPLTPIAGYLRILQGEKLGALSAQQRRVVEAMSHASVRLTRIVENLSDFATLGAGAARLHEAAFDPDLLADEVVEEHRNATRDGHLHVVVVHAMSGPVFGDARKLRQALGNLVSNAMKFSPHGGEVRVEVARAPEHLRFLVWDQGPGIPPGEAEGIFEPLRHAGRRGTDDTRAPGSGLGLPVARRIAEAHGGALRVESPPRTQPAGAGHAFAGALFVLEMPLRPAGEGGGVAPG